MNIQTFQTSRKASNDPVGDHTVRTIRLEFENIHTGLRLTSYSPEEDLRCLEMQMQQFDRTMAGEDRKHLIRYKPQDLFENAAHCIVAEHEGQVVGSMYAHLDDAKLLWIKGVTVDAGRYRGNRIASAMAALSILHGTIASPSIRGATCAYRIQADGTENHASAKSLSKVGFHRSDEIGFTKISGTYKDRHLAEFSEHGSSGPFFRYRRMFATKRSVLSSMFFLQNWCNHVLPMHQA